MLMQLLAGAKKAAMTYTWDLIPLSGTALSELADKLLCSGI